MSRLHIPSLRATPLQRGPKSTLTRDCDPLWRGVPALSAVALAKAEGRGVVGTLEMQFVAESM